MTSSSYLNTVTFLDIFKTIFTLQRNIKTVVEFGILNGHSLQTMCDNSPPDCKFYAYDIFDEFNGNHADCNIITEKFKDKPNVSISYGDFYNKPEYIQHNIDVLHVDIANNGDVYEFAVNNYLDLLSPTGIMILEGGSARRDQVEWMSKYNKRCMAPVIDMLRATRPDLTIVIIGEFPSLTIIQHA